jgi:ATP-dependent Clp protease ATP-binding subunit ClpB
LKRVEKLLGEQKINLEISPAACEHLVEVGYDPVYGARPIKRAIQRQVENAIATKILENAFIAGDTIMIDKNDRGLSFQKKTTSKSAILPTPVTLVESEV